MERLKVYLAGSMRNGWADRVMRECPDFVFFDPRSGPKGSEHEYTMWDLARVAESDLVFAYMDSTNPAGYGLCVEVGYAYAKEVWVWYVNEDLTERQRWFGMVRGCAEMTFTSLYAGIAALQKLAKKA